MKNEDIHHFIFHAFIFYAERTKKYLTYHPVGGIIIVTKGTEENEMKKYNLSNIMKRAWELVKKVGTTISSGLKKAWEEAKHIMIKFENMAKVAIVNKNGETSPFVGTEKDDPSNYLTFRMWEKNGHKRIYVNDYKRRTVAYIDCNANNSVESEYSKGDIFETIKYFVENYEF